MSSYPKAQLCELCQYVFSSRWVAKDSIQLRNADQEGKVTREEDSCNSDDNASFSDGFYEAPDWVTVVTTDDATPRLLEVY
jgi:hypothetical protein